MLAEYVSVMLNRFKYLKHALMRSPRYTLTKKVREFLLENENIMEKSEQQGISSYLKSHLIDIFNYDFVPKYSLRYVRVLRDRENGLSYVYTLERRRLYFKRGMSDKEITKVYNFLCMEQADGSPHNYSFSELDLNESSVVVDIGAAEGIFSLKIIDLVHEVYLFECDADWREALEATFYP